MTHHLQATAPPPALPWLGADVNAVSPEALLALFDATGFLYPAKRERLAPYLPLILDNTRRAMEAGDLMWVMSYETDGKLSSSMSYWRTTEHGMQSQHLVSLGNSAGARAVILDGIHLALSLNLVSKQNWFRPTNTYAARVFGSLREHLGAEGTSLVTHEYLACPLHGRLASDPGVSVVPANGALLSELVSLATHVHGAEYFDLAALDARYRRVGLRRYRRAWLTYARGHDGPVAAAVAHRGPLGLNFSFLENRCDLLVAPGLAPDVADAAVHALLAAATPTYADFEPGFIPVTTDPGTAAGLVAEGARPIQTYAQSAWLRRHFEAYYHHVEGFYRRVAETQARRAAPALVPQAA